ncbi:hypothetical protein [Metabacillus fastidiosus]|uniref:hypothetical protein n=1 Tax=Metabacillus fastidiosus TaxID=1458 RepID=UPI000826F99F|nr:hypothetical protein [Metabacillus fastidiosus]MED4461778.1 hypothetical protein [Metabacillus fastidiosus]
MNIKLSMEEKIFLNDVLKELKQYQISVKDRKNIKQQILEHIQESREHGGDSINELGDKTIFVKDFLEINGIDLYSKIKEGQISKSKTGILFVVGVCTLIATYLCSQLILSMFLTESFNPLNYNENFDYNIFYQISDNSWWNALLMSISIIASIIISMLIVFFTRRSTVRW